MLNSTPMNQQTIGDRSYKVYTRHLSLCGVSNGIRIGALFLYRYGSQGHDGDSETQGVRISIPLTRIIHVQRYVHADLSTLVTVTTSPGANDRLPCPNMRTFQLGPIMPVTTWDRLEGIICDAKLTARQHLNPTSRPDSVYVDFGSLCSPKDSSNRSLEISEPKAVVHALGIEPDSDLWSAFPGHESAFRS